MSFKITEGLSVKSLWLSWRGCGFVICNEKNLNAKYQSNNKNYYISLFWRMRHFWGREFNKIPPIPILKERLVKAID